MLNTTLQNLGFSSKEIQVYLTVLQQGKTTPADVAKVTGINRTTVYSVAKELIKRGVIAEDLGAKTRYLVARPPEDLELFAQKEEKALEQKKALIEKAVKELRTVSKQAQYTIPKIIFIAEEDLENYLYKQSPQWTKSIMHYDNTWWGFQDYSFVEHYHKWIDWHWRAVAPKEFQIKLLSNRSDIEKIMQKREYASRRHIKFLSGSNAFSATTWVCGDYVIMLVTKTRPHHLVEIHDAVLAHNMRELFKRMWKQVR